MSVVSTVALPRWLIGLLVGALAVCLVAVAFLLGRVTAPAPGSAPFGVAAATQPAIETTGTGAATDTEVPAAPGSAPTLAADAGGAASQWPPLGEGPAFSPAESAGPPGGERPDASAVAAYFEQMDAVAAQFKASQDPQAVARGLINQAMSGNTSGLESLIATQRSLGTRLEQIVPPAACREHHQRSVRLFGRAVAMLERTRDAMAGQGAAADLASVASEGRAIEAEARALDALANDLRRAAGLAPLP